MIRSLILSLCALLPLTATAQDNLLAGMAARPSNATELLTDEGETLEAPAAPGRVADRATLLVTGSYLLSDGPLTVELRDEMNRPLLRLAAPTPDASAEGLRLAAPALPAGTYSVRVLDARGQELHRNRVVYRPR